MSKSPPFELPVRTVEQSAKLGIFLVRAANQKAVAEILTKEQADYIVQAINSHEKLVKALQYLVADHPAGLLPDKPKSLLQAVEALESEKQE